MRFHLLLLAGLTVSSAALAGTKTLSFKQGVNIDGKNTEWSSPLPNFDKNTGINFDVANDDRQLYFILRIADNAIQQQIMQNGLEIWINTAGKKKKTTGVIFPVPMKKASKNGLKGRPSGGPEGGLEGGLVGGPEISGADRTMPEGQDVQGIPGNGQSEAADNQDEMVPDKRRQGPGMMPQNQLILNGFLIDNGLQAIQGCPVKAAISTDQSGCLIYELAVPFNTFFKEKLDAGDLNTVFCIGFVIKSNTTSDENSDMPGGMMGGGPDGGMGGGPMGGGPGGMGGGPMGGGMMGGPMGGSNMNSRSGQTTLSEKKCWFKVKPSIP